MKTAIKRITEALKNKDIETAEKLLPLAQKLAYRAAAKGHTQKRGSKKGLKNIQKS